MLHPFHFVAMVSMFMVVASSAEADSGLLMTKGSSTEKVLLPANESVSTLLFWTQLPNTTLHLKIFSMANFYDIDVNVSRPGIWHIGYFYQPYALGLQANTSSLKIPSCLRYMTFSTDRVENLTLSSDDQVYWMLCGNIYACSLQPPNQEMRQLRHMNPESGSTHMFYLFIGASLLCALLVCAVVGLTVFLFRKKRLNHLYEKPVWPPLPPPLPALLSQPGNQSTGEPVDDGQIIIQGGDNLSHKEEEDVNQRNGTFHTINDDPRTSILEHDSLNSLYGCVIR